MESLFLPPLLTTTAAPKHQRRKSTGEPMSPAPTTPTATEHAFGLGMEWAPLGTKTDATVSTVAAIMDSLLAISIAEKMPEAATAAVDAAVVATVPDDVVIVAEETASPTTPPAVPAAPAAPDPQASAPVIVPAENVPDAPEEIDLGSLFDDAPPAASDPPQTVAAAESSAPAPAPEAAAAPAEAQPDVEVTWATVTHRLDCPLCEYFMNCGFADPSKETGECSICKETTDSLCNSVYDYGIEHWPKEACYHRFCQPCLEGWITAHLSEMKTTIKCPDETCKCALFPDDVHRVNNDLYAKLTFLTSRDFTTRLAEAQSTPELAEWLAENTKPCPKCMVIINRSEGCNYMVCHCGTQFCYVCGLDYNESSHDYCG